MGTTNPMIHMDKETGSHGSHKIPRVMRAPLRAPPRAHHARPKSWEPWEPAELASKIKDFAVPTRFPRGSHGNRDALSFAPAAPPP
jgi:hypothetical protein